MPFCVKICNYCGKEYSVPEHRKDISMFCSDECSRRSRNTQVEYFCDYCGKPFKVRKSKIDKLHSGLSKHLCCSSECAKNIQKPKWEDICNLFKKRDFILKSTKYINAKDKLEYICKKHPNRGSQFITYNNLKRGFGCKYCGIESTASSRRLTNDEVKEIFKRHDMDLLDGQVYYNTSDLMAYICVHHKEKGVQYMTTSNAYRNRCPYCCKSKGETRIEQYLILNSYKYIHQYKFSGLKGVGGGLLSYDFYLPDYDVLIEYQGEFHDGTTNNLQTKEGLSVQVEHDRRKKEYADKHGLTLIEIWYYDFNNIEHILSNSLNIA